MLVGIAAGVANRHLGGFTHLLDLRHQLLAPVPGERWDADADGFAVRLRVQAEIRGLDRLADGGDGSGVEGLDENLGGLGRGDGGEALEIGLRAVVVDLDVLDEGGGGSAGPHAAQLVLQVVDGLGHGFVAFKDGGVGVHD